MSAVRSPVRSPVRLPVRDALRTEGFSPVSLFFGTGAQGAWYDPSDYSTLFQNSTGTTPVTAVEQPVRLMLDRSRGLVLGPELVTNGNFSDGTTGWTQTPSGFDSATVVSGAVRITTAGVGAAAGLTQALPLIVGRSYLATGKIRSVSGAAVRLTVTNNAFSSVVASGDDVTSTTFTDVRLVFTATEVNNLIYLRVGAVPGIGEFDNVSVRELPGNHALAPNDASRPVLRSRYNALTFSEQFGNAVWETASRLTITSNTLDTTDPIGGNTAEKGTETVDNGSHRVFQQFAFQANTTYTGSVYWKKGTRRWVYITFQTASSPATQIQQWFDLDNGVLGTNGTGAGGTQASKVSASITSVGNGWFRCLLTVAFGATVTIDAFSGFFTGLADADGTIGYAGTISDFGYIWGAQLLTSADQTVTGGAYQRIAAATDYDTSNPVWRPYLAFDGSDDSLSTSAIDFSGTDEMTVFAGVTKLSDANDAMLLELSADINSNAGSFYITAPENGTNVRFKSRGSINPSVPNAATFAAPGTRVLRAYGDISTDTASVFLNGSSAATTTQDQGTGNFGNYPLFIGRRNNASAPFNGRLTSLIVLGRTATAAEISATEQWVAGKTGVNLP